MATSTARRAPDENAEKTLQMFREAIIRKSRRHDLIYTFVVRYELNGDKSAEEDATHFKRMVATLGLPAPAEWIISSDHDTESLLLVRTVVSQIADRCAAHQGRSLIIGHFAGIARYWKCYLRRRQDEKALVTAYDYLGTVHVLVYGEGSGSLDRTDVVLITSPYPGIPGFRSDLPSNMDRSVELISPALAPRDFLTRGQPLMARLADEIDCQLGRGRTGIMFADVVETLNVGSAASARTNYRLLVGAVEIRIASLRSRSSARLAVGPSRPGQEAAATTSADFSSASLTSGTYTNYRDHLQRGGVVARLIDICTPEDEEVESVGIVI
ncbi:MAG: hypothetical protein M1815_005756 [Lichina confinis]|nr:MAG: hypothetical protein M1815_005756 [Lichina confinis]